MRRRFGGLLGLLFAVCAACGFSGEGAPDIPLPTSARPVDTRATQADFHGDNATWFIYELSAEHARAYAQAPLWWMREGAGKWENSGVPPAPSPAVAWQDGPLADELAQIVAGFEGADLRQRSVRYAHKRVEGGWERLIVIDVPERRLYYYRETW